MAQLPILQQMGSELVDLIFVPKIVARQLVVWVALETGLLTLKQVATLCRAVLSHVSSRNPSIANHAGVTKTLHYCCSKNTLVYESRKYEYPAHSAVSYISSY